jgi:hypothetical protein
MGDPIIDETGWIWQYWPSTLILVEPELLPLRHRSGRTWHRPLPDLEVTRGIRPRPTRRTSVNTFALTSDSTAGGCPRPSPVRSPRSPSVRS